MESNTKSALERLPPELRLEILCQFDTLASLVPVIQTCRAFRGAYLQSPSTVIKKLLIQELAADGVVCQAIATRRILELPEPAPRKLFVDYLNDFLRSRTDFINPASLDLRDALQMESLNVVVRNFTKKFAQQCLNHAAKRFAPRHTRPSASDDEQIRIRRAFYLAEIYISTYRGEFETPTAHRYKIARALFNYLAKWEREILFCVTSYLYTQTAQVYNVLVTHDVYWGSLETKPILNYNSQVVNTILFGGLELVNRVLVTDDYHKRSSLFMGAAEMARVSSAGIGPSLVCHDAVNTKLCMDVLTPPSPTSGTDWWNHGNTDAEYILYQTEGRREPSPFLAYDDGSEKIHSWATWLASISRHPEATLEHFDLLQWGFALWDFNRIEELLVLERNWNSICKTENQGLEEKEAAMGVVEPMEGWESSWDRRSRIYEGGGRGWWNYNDFRRIVWMEE